MERKPMERIESVKNPRVKAARALHTVKGRDESGMFLCEGEHMVREAVRAIGAAYALSSSFALGSSFAIDTLFVDESMEDKYLDLIGDAHAGHAFLVPAHVLSAVSAVKSPQGIAAVVRLQVPPVTRRNYLGMLEGQELPDFADDVETSPPFAGGDSELSENEALPDSWDPDEDLTDDGDAPAAWSENLPPPEDDAVSPSVLGDKLVLLENVQDPGNVGAILRTMDGAGFSGAILSPGCADPFSPKALRATMGAVFRVPTMQAEN
ncbi:MAG: TrmH family RNA methyltransferase, partial [Bacillota bacterium]